MIGDSRGHANGRVRTEWTFGPAFFGLVFQTLVGIIAVVFFYGQQVSTNETTKATTAKLEQILERAVERSNGLNDRLIRVEAVTEGINTTVKSLDNKLSQIQQHQP